MFFEIMKLSWFHRGRKLWRESAGSRCTQNIEQIKELSQHYSFRLTGLREEGVESVVTATDGLVGGHLPVRLDSVLQAVELPARIS